MKKDTLKIQYKKYMKVMELRIKDIKEGMKQLPSVEKMSKLTFDEWCKLHKL